MLAHLLLRTDNRPVRVGPAELQAVQEAADQRHAVAADPLAALEVRPARASHGDVFEQKALPTVLDHDRDVVAEVFQHDMEAVVVALGVAQDIGAQLVDQNLDIVDVGRVGLQVIQKGPAQYASDLDIGQVFRQFQ